MIAANLVTNHLWLMPKIEPTAQEKLLSPNTFAEMRPERIGHRLRLLREALGLKPAEMADRLGIERTYWSRFENGKRPVTETTAALLADRFGVTLDFLILGKWQGVPMDLAERMRAVDAQNK